MTFNDFKTKVKSLLLYDQDSDDPQVVSYIDALIVEWMYEAMFYVDNYRVGNTDTFLPAAVDDKCDGGRVDLPAELYKLESVAIVKKAADLLGLNYATTDGIDDIVQLGADYGGSAIDVNLSFETIAPAGTVIRTNQGNFTQSVDNDWEEHGVTYSWQGASLLLGTDIGSDFTESGWRNVTEVRVSDGVTLSEWHLDEQSSGSLDGVVAIDSAGSNDGVYLGCDGAAPDPIPGCETVVDLDPIAWDQRDEILNGQHCNKYTIDSRATEIYFRPIPEDDEETGETQWLRIEWEGTKTDYSGQEVVPYGFDAAKNCADFINMNLAVKKNDKPAKANRFEKMFDRGMQRLFKTQRAKSQQG